MKNATQSADYLSEDAESPQAMAEEQPSAQTPATEVVSPPNAVRQPERKRRKLNLKQKVSIQSMSQSHLPHDNR